MIFNWLKKIQESKEKRSQLEFKKEFRRISRAFKEIESRKKVISKSETQEIIEYEVPQFAMGEIYSVKRRLILNYEPIYLNNEQLINVTSKIEKESR